MLEQLESASVCMPDLTVLFNRWSRYFCVLLRAQYILGFAGWLGKLAR